MINSIDDVFDMNAEWINIFQGKETIDDPFEKNVETTLLNPLPIKAIVNDLTVSQAMWKMPGIKVSKVKEIYIHKKYRTLVENSQKIEIRNSDKVTESYEGWRENGRMQIREEGDFLRVYVYSKHT